MRSVVATVLASLTLAAPALAWDAQTEAENFARITQRSANDQASAEYQAAYLQAGLGSLVDILARDAAEGGERFSGSLCGAGMLTCAGDPRVTDWGGLVVPVTYINRNGAHIEGHVYAQKDAVEERLAAQRRARSTARLARRAAARSTALNARRRKAPHSAASDRAAHRAAAAARRAAREAAAAAAKAAKLKPLPGVVIETGSVQAPERWYLWAAQVLANHGYAVMTFDVQGQGRSDLFGTHDQHAFDGVPAQDVTHFVEDLQDAVDFFHSTAEQPYVPRTAHAKARHGRSASPRARSSRRTHSPGCSTARRSASSGTHSAPRRSPSSSRPTCGSTRRWPGTACPPVPA